MTLKADSLRNVGNVRPPRQEGLQLYREPCDSSPEDKADADVIVKNGSIMVWSNQG